MSTADFLDVTGDDIAQLDDDDLRDLIGKLCEADYLQNGLPTKGITWGGNQNAPDGGLDVVVCDDVNPPDHSVIVRKNTGFQVKKPDMPKSKIDEEMRPDGVLRPEIQALIKNGGSYIIACSSGSTSHSALKKRIQAMKDAVANEDNNENLHIDFLDRGRIATWVRSHKSAILWVRNKIGRPLQGWRPFENWADNPDGVEEEYILDDSLKLFDDRRPHEEGMKSGDGIVKLRSELSAAGASVRLAGLSGVGKTRLVQALFDNRIGTNSLNPAHVLYTDTSYGPSPDPTVFAEQLVASNTRAIVIVDNCPPELHRDLTKICSQSQSTVSLLTVEYDVRDDIPRETKVFRLEPASDETIEKLLLSRFPHVGQVDARKIAEISGGNARVANAIADTVEEGQSLSSFRDDDLFKRLFWQKNSQSDDLLRSAEACSLVYSFEGTDSVSKESELVILSSLIDKPASDFYRDIKTLQDRNLVQSRGPWRAVLPHAIANWLARQALASIPKDVLVNTVLNQGTERLIKSFTRRLNYLHDCDIAIEIVNKWLSDDDWIGKNILNLNDFGIQVFQNIAPIVPERTLEVIERAANDEENGASFTSRENKHHSSFVRLLRKLAYDPELFSRSVEIIKRFALSEAENENYDSSRDVLKSLFYIHLSGTHATIEDRAAFIQSLLDSEDEAGQTLGLSLLDAALETNHFSSSYEFSFGSRRRDYGFYPNNSEEFDKWFGTFILMSAENAISEKSSAEKARKILANNLRGLWRNTRMHEAIKDVSLKIRDKMPWSEGWIALNNLLRYDGKGLDDDALAKVKELQDILKPDNLLELAQTYALSDQHFLWDLEDGFDDESPSDGLSRTALKTKTIAAEVAQDQEILKILLPEIVSTHNSRLFDFGKGLAEGCEDKARFWRLLCDQFEETLPEKRCITVLRGFLNACSEIDADFYNSALDDLIEDEVLGSRLPEFQTLSIIDDKAIERLNTSLDSGKADIDTFYALAYGRAHESISDRDLGVLLNKITAREGGIPVVIMILVMRFHRQAKDKTYDPILIDAGVQALISCDFDEKKPNRNRDDHDLSRVVGVCLKGVDKAEDARVLCQNLFDAIINYRIYAFNFHELLNTLAEIQPEVFLDVFLGNDQIEQFKRSRMFSSDFERHDNPLKQIPDNVFLEWCEQDPGNRYPLAAETIPAFKTGETGKLEWMSVARSILVKAPVLNQILDNLSRSIRPMAWSGSRADILQERSKLILDLFKHENSEVVAWAKMQYSQLKHEIEDERKRENERDRARHESFE